MTTIKAPPVVLAIDFGSQALRFGLFRKRGRKWNLSALDECPITCPWESQNLIDVIQNFLRKNGRVRKPGIIGSWRAGFLEKPIVLPEMPESEIRSAMTFGMEQHFQLKLDECLHDWAVSVDVTSQQGTKAKQFFIYAVKKSDVSQLTEALKAIPHVLLSLAPASVANAVYLAETLEKNTADIGVLDIGAHGSSLLIFRGGRPLLARAIDVGGKALLERLREPKSSGPEDRIAPSEAESILERMTLDPEGASDLRPDVNASALLRIEDGLNQLVDTIDATIVYYNQQDYGGQLGGIFLCGKGSQLKGLDRYMEKRVEVPFRRVAYKDMLNLTLSSETKNALSSNMAKYTTLIGSFLNWQKDVINLLPQDIVLKNQARGRSRMMLVCAAFVALVSIGMIAFAGHSLIKANRSLRKLKVEINTSRGALQLADQIEVERQFQRGQSKGQIPLSAFLKFLSIKIPPNCAIDTIGYHRPTRQLTMSGKIYGSVKNPVSLCTDFVNTLTQSPFLERAELTEGVWVKEQGIYRFRIKGIAYES